ncbi:MAG: hypothetical protein OHK93_006863 [Ramalina farinacea]|uniref:Cell division cycle protein 123 n=1 Tax=Ramalina farinacea TaxID=258253 RepID=A0AA43TTH8_9LECA|nr:hypothetical protein [Ramalina farinacea]
MVNLQIKRFAAVAAALDLESESFTEQRVYNTSFHTREDITAVLPSIHHPDPEEQPWILLRPWLPLIMESQGISPESVHEIRLPSTFLTILESTFRSGLSLGRVNRDDMRDLVSYFPMKSANGCDIVALLQGQKILARLDTCSLKDAIIGQGPIKNISDICARLATSARGTKGLRDLREGKPGYPCSLFLFPWRDEIRTELEYRVFCPPGTRIAAISQYRWHQPWYHHDASTHDQLEIATKLVHGCEELYDQIIKHAGDERDEVTENGFVFDVVEIPQTHEVQLLELNCFGAMTGCGACLFHWIKDAEILYGLREGVKVRVTI